MFLYIWGSSRRASSALTQRTRNSIFFSPKGSFGSGSRFERNWIKKYGRIFYFLFPGKEELGGTSGKVWSKRRWDLLCMSYRSLNISRPLFSFSLRFSFICSFYFSFSQFFLFCLLLTFLLFPLLFFFSIFFLLSLPLLPLLVAVTTNALIFNALVLYCHYYHYFCSYFHSLTRNTIGN